jgi:hypothetical protein
MDPAEPTTRMKPDDEFQVPKSSKGNKKAWSSKRAYIGNLPHNLDGSALQQRLQTLLHESLQIDVTAQAITVHGCDHVINSSSSRSNTTTTNNDSKKTRKSPHALVECPPGTTVDQVISKLHKTTLDGKTIVVQREQRKGGEGDGKPRREGPNNFRTWSQPLGPTPPPPLPPATSSFHRNPTAPPTIATNMDTTLTTTTSTTATTATATMVERPVVSLLPPPRRHLLDEEAERLGQVVAKEFEDAEENGEDLINLALASTAAMTLLASMDAFGTSPLLPPYGEEEETKNYVTDGDDNTDNNHNEYCEEEETEMDSGGDFMARCAAQPLSALLDDFGEADPNWMKVQHHHHVTDDDEDEEDEKECEASSLLPLQDEQQEYPEQQQQTQESRLVPHGKAPIHVEFTSFGYLHGAPPELRNGWSHMNPLVPADCTDFPTVPPYLEWQDGLSAPVKRILLQTSQYQIRHAATQLAYQVGTTALVEAIAEGHGYALPLTMTIFVGSQSGRHRSVLYCELAATALRKILRQNKENRITQPVSVGTRHSHLERGGPRGGGRKERGASTTKTTTNTSRGQTKNKLDLEGDW